MSLIPVDPTPDEVQYLEDRIDEFNSSATAIADGELLAFFVHECDRIMAGICGNTWGGPCELGQSRVEESQRQRGLGTKLFQAAEQEAQRRGSTQIVLMTFSFQAPTFYVLQASAGSGLGGSIALAIVAGAYISDQRKITPGTN